MFSLISAESAYLSHNQNNHIFEKKRIFGSKICSRGAKSCPIRIARSSQYHINLPYKPTNLIFGFRNINFLLKIFSTFFISDKKSTEIVSESSVILYPYVEEIIKELEKMGQKICYVTSSKNDPIFKMRIFFLSCTSSNFFAIGDINANSKYNICKIPSAFDNI